MQEYARRTRVQKVAGKMRIPRNESVRQVCAKPRQALVAPRKAPVRNARAYMLNVVRVEG